VVTWMVPAGYDGLFLKKEKEKKGKNALTLG
jgi:hypothetical protein